MQLAFVRSDDGMHLARWQQGSAGWTFCDLAGALAMQLQAELAPFFFQVHPH